jgi:hypothetical protein
MGALGYADGLTDQQRIGVLERDLVELKRRDEQLWSTLGFLVTFTLVINIVAIPPLLLLCFIGAELYQKPFYPALCAASLLAVGIALWFRNKFLVRK